MKQGRGIPPPSFLPNSSMEGELTTNSSDTSEIMGISWESERCKNGAKDWGPIQKRRKRETRLSRQDKFK